MRISYLRFFLFLFSLYFFSCSEKPQSGEFSEYNDDVSYKLVSFGADKKKAKHGDFLLIDAKYKLENDSVFWSSETDAGGSYIFKLSDETLKNKIWSFVFGSFSEGDSIHLKINSEVFFREVFGSSVPAFTSKSRIILSHIFIKSVMNPDEFEKYKLGKNFRLEAAAWSQKVQIENYVKLNMKNAVMLDSLLFFEKISSTLGDEVRPGKNVSLVYEGRHLNGKIIDRTTEKQPLVFTYSTNNQIIRGLEIAISRMKKGESAKIIIPSHLGFGNETDGRLSPFTPLVYEIKIIEIK